MSVINIFTEIHTCSHTYSKWYMVNLRDMKHKNEKVITITYLGVLL